mgnify:CR=1 FL=1
MRHALNAVRSALFVLFMAVTVIPWALAVLVVSIFAKGNVVYWMCVGWLRTAIWGAKVICGVHARLHGFDHLPDTPVVMLPKHQSTWETFAFPGLMPHPLCYVFKRELLYIPFFGWAIGRLDMIHIDRSKRTEAWNKVAEQGRRIMARGKFGRDAQAPAKFKAGDRVRARNMHPLTHTRLPRYVRGHVGVIERNHGAQVFPDSAAIEAGENPQWLYTVVFDGAELWGPDSDPTLKISIDAFEPYLEKA